MARPKQSTSGINLGGAYLRADKALRVQALLHLSPSSNGQHAIAYAQQLFISDEHADTLLGQEEFRLAAKLAFPEQATTIEDLYHYALHLARTRRNEPDIHPRQQVQDKLLLEEVMLFNDILLKYERQETDILEVRRRLGSVIYYAVQQFVHDIRAAIKHGVEHSNDLLIIEDIQHAISFFQGLVQRSSTQAGHSICAGFEAARRKFGLRVLLLEKNEEIERMLMQNLPD